MIGKISDILFWTQFSGFHNYANKTLTYTIPAQTVPAWGSVQYSGSVAIDRTEAISQLRLNYSGLETAWRLLDGVLIVNKPTYDAPTYQLLTVAWYSGGRLYAKTVISDQSGSGASIPNITVTIEAGMFLVPFS